MFESEWFDLGGKESSIDWTHLPKLRKKRELEREKESR